MMALITAVGTTSLQFDLNDVVGTRLVPNPSDLVVTHFACVTCAVFTVRVFMELKQLLDFATLITRFNGWLPTNCCQRDLPKQEIRSTALRA
jgi:hypothetical protein